MNYIIIFQKVVFFSFISFLTSQQAQQTLTHDTGQGAHPSIVQVSTNVFAVAYHGDNGKGVIKTFSIASDGSTITENQELQHDGSKAKYNSLIQVDSDTYLLAYEGGSNDGFIKTFTIPSTGIQLHRLHRLSMIMPTENIIHWSK